MPLSKQKIAEVAHLAKLQLEEHDIEKFTDINDILKLAEQIQKIDTQDVAPMSHPLNISQRLREDSVTEMNQRNALQSVAPQKTEFGLYLVPQVIEMY